MAKGKKFNMSDLLPANGNGYGSGTPSVIYVLGGSGNRFITRRKVIAAGLGTVLGVAGYMGRDLGSDFLGHINSYCIKSDSGWCATGWMAAPLQTKPREIPASLRREGANSQVLGSYAVNAGKIARGKDGHIVVFPTFTYSVEGFTDAYGATYTDKAGLAKPVTPEQVNKLTLGDIVASMTVVKKGASEAEKKRALETAQMCRDDMAAVVQKAQVHAGWLLRDSTDIPAKDLLTAENAYAIAPYTMKPDSPNVPNVYVGLMVQSTDPATKQLVATPHIVTCQLTEAQ
ncbi:hypothetical protein IPL85_00565 [Candidatus Saccharibacteria bacterium]|nr:MAG: hypothetical protein IPL85_00565 [Candidatus Saccharibacteria bacterium]